MWSFQDPVSEKNLNRLQPGMTEKEITEILGDPSTRNGETQLNYDKLFVFGWVSIFLDKDLRYQGKYNYERF